MEQNIEKQNTKRRSTFAVLFYINRTKIRKDGMCQLLCKVSIDAEWAQIGTKVSVNPAIWNPEKGRADGRSENAVTVNRAIDDLTSEIAGHYDRIKNSLGFITAELVKNAVKGYREINMKGLKLVKDGGYLATCSCSHFMTQELLAKTIREAARSTHKRLRQVEFRTQSADHPILWAADESYYLKFFIFQVVDEK